MDVKIFRCYMEKKNGFDTEARLIHTELTGFLGVKCAGVRLFHRYDVQNLSADNWPAVMNTVLSEPMSDICFEETLPALPANTRLLFIEPLPGQFDQRASACEQCIQMLLGGERPLVRSARVLAFKGVSDVDFIKIKNYLINPVECREAQQDKPATLERSFIPPDVIPRLDGFTDLSEAGLAELRSSFGLAMDIPDLLCFQNYFKSENRQPTVTELRVVDTYWSDHCRHTTFHTIIETADIQDERVQKAYDLFLSVKGDKPVTLMNIATASMKHLRAQGKLPMFDDSAESNACTVRIKADIGGNLEDWLLFFKNETHNHPTEIEPFGGAATCLGGGIRDPLSGRSYVYQAMRITGAGDPRRSFCETLPGKLPQRKLTTTAAAGHSSYANQIGMAAGFAKEIYHEGYVAKRMEAGALVAAAPQDWVRRETPAPGDIVLLIGGRTGRDGIGGATGSSRVQDINAASVCAAEVQKGDAAEERKIVRLFRNPNVTKLIKRCNDFGAGGVSVAIGELADGLFIDLDKIPVKYEGMDGTELAIAESQERMAVVIASVDEQKMLALTEAEGLEATAIARVTDNRRLVMYWRGDKIVDIARDFLDTNGAVRHASISVPPTPAPYTDIPKGTALPEKLLTLAGDLNFCSQKGMVKLFDSTAGAGTVFMQYGGETASTETQVMAALIPAPGARTASLMAYGFDPFASSADPFMGAVSAVVTSVAKLAAAGADISTVHLSLQEFFPSIKNDPARWGLPFSALLGAFSAELGLGIAAIGGKDSMSGSFEKLDVPPTLISFAVALGEASKLISPEFKKARHPVYLLEAPRMPDGTPDYPALLEKWKLYSELVRNGKVVSGWACEKGGVYGGIMKMSLGNMIGFSGEDDEGLFNTPCGSILFEATQPLDGFRLLGYTQSAQELVFGKSVIPISALRTAWENSLEGVFPTKFLQSGAAPLVAAYTKRAAPRSGSAFARPQAVLPVFPGTNGDWDAAAAIQRAGGAAERILIRNLMPDMLRYSAEELEKAIRGAQIIVFPGGYSGDDQPDGSGRYIVSFFQNERLVDAVRDLLENRDGLVLGIGSGFQALVKLGLLPYGQFRPMKADSPTIVCNSIGRHQSRYVTTRVTSTLSPWLSECKTGELYVLPVSHGEGRLVASEEMLCEMEINGQIAFQYVRSNGFPSMDIAVNPNGSVLAIEGICSPDGRILGKMAHAERYGEYAAKNVLGNKYLPLFEGGIRYFK
ncbi:MAG: phosphoribosylformylglycinamidine synthase [Spirochaetes bacterium]|nr:phosphoribosylformylglycinamidine synthase [Spirochaetota bacterium]